MLPIIQRRGSRRVTAYLEVLKVLRVADEAEDVVEELLLRDCPLASLCGSFRNLKVMFVQHKSH